MHAPVERPTLDPVRLRLACVACDSSQQSQRESSKGPSSQAEAIHETQSWLSPCLRPWLGPSDSDLAWSRSLLPSRIWGKGGCVSVSGWSIDAAKPQAAQCLGFDLLVGVYSAGAMLHRSLDSLCMLVVAALASVAKSNVQMVLVSAHPLHRGLRGPINSTAWSPTPTVWKVSRSVRRNPARRPNLSAYREYALMGTSGRLPSSADADGEATELGSNLPHSTMALERLSAPSCCGVDVHAISPLLQVGIVGQKLRPGPYGSIPPCASRT